MVEAKDLVAVVLAMFTFFGLILRWMHLRTQGIIKEREDQMRLEILQAQDAINRANTNAEILKSMINVMENRDKRTDDHMTRQGDVQNLQLDALRELTDSVKLQTQRMIEIDAIAKQLKTDLGETREALTSIPLMVGNQFNPVVLNLSALMIKIESFLARAVDWDERMGLFAGAANEQFGAVNESIAGLRLEMSLIRQHFGLPEGPITTASNEEDTHS